MSDTTYTAWQLARLADCMDPDSPDSPGAQFLDSVESAYRDAVNEGWYDDDSPHEIADNAVPVYTHARWLTFVDLGAYQEDTTDLGDDGSDLTQSAALALYMIADRLVRALHDERDDDTDDEDDDGGGITPEGLALGHRYVMGNVNAYCPKCSDEQSVTVLDCDYDLDK